VGGGGGRTVYKCGRASMQHFTAALVVSSEHGRNMGNASARLCSWGPRRARGTEVPSAHDQERAKVRTKKAWYETHNLYKDCLFMNTVECSYTGRASITRVVPRRSRAVLLPHLCHLYAAPSNSPRQFHDCTSASWRRCTSSHCFARCGTQENNRFRRIPRSDRNAY
jgi:hypothetical protein